MNDIQAVAVLTLFAVLAGIEIWRGRFFASEATREDKRLDAAVIVIFPLMIIPTIFFTSYWLGARYFPEYQDALAQWPWWAMVVTL